MSAKWEDFIQDGSFGGIVFDFVDAREQHANVLDIQEFPARDGQTVEKRARKGLRLNILAVFIEEDYPEKLWDLSAKLDDGTPQEFVHPIHGRMMAACESHEVQHTSEDADSGTIQIQLVEHTENASLVFQDRPSIAAKASEVRSDAADVTTSANVYLDAQINTLLETMSSAVALGSLVYATTYNLVQATIATAELVASVADTLEADGDTMSALAISALSNQGLSSVDTQVTALSNYTTEAAYDLGRALLLAAAALGQLAQQLIEYKPPLVVYTIGVDISLLSWVHAQYQDSSRVDEVLSLNNIPDPLLLPAGSQLRAYAV